MDLLEINNSGHVYPSIHALTIEPFKSMWENDTSDNREDVLRDFRYVELMCSPKKSNPYFGYIDMDIREKRVKMEVYKDENYHTTTDMLLATMKYKECLAHSSPSFPLLDDAIASAEKTRKWCTDFNLDERTPNGAMVIKPADIDKALNQIPITVKKLEDLRTQVVMELKEASKTRKDREPGFFER